jgi:cytochrome c553
MASSAPNPAFPILDGQPAPYIATQLRLFRDAERGGGPYAPLMTSAARGLADADIEALAAWFSNR